MLVLNDRRECTAAEYARLFEAAGLRLTRIIPTASDANIIEGERASACCAHHPPWKDGSITTPGATR
jgi:hypothetical protein